ncbi:TonB family protein [Paracoccus sp. DMF-8]|uniref:energy transducer TonB family protein n=1 Tax=Paracoccus sp. DMF-8 TaxID=3019445 RepID=UPI0023E8C6E3|nr:TonB family protein [Paracoccus sp. DMF-8]MDF3604837.1 TonB family protein [Paracoccus sp. DMF-8]
MSSRTGNFLRDSAAWGTAGLIVLTAHVATAAWLMRDAEAAQISGLPEPVFIDMAEMPMAAAEPEEVEQVEQEESKPEPEPEPDFSELPLPELEPLPDMNSLFPPPPDAVVLTRSERPQPRPEKREEPKVVERREPEPEPKRERRREPEAVQQRQSTRVDAPRADRTAARSAPAGNVTRRQTESWQSTVQSRVARHMNRTRMPGRRGSLSTQVRVSISANGTVTGARINGSTGDPAVDAALSRQAARMPNLPPHPSGTPQSLVVPVVVQFR